jgi:hypothetical protein
MTLDEDDKKFLTDLIKGLVPASSLPAPIPRLTVRQFAVAVGFSEELVRRKIRIRAIPPAMVYGPPYRLSPRALDIFRVTPQEAIERLKARNLWPEAQPSAA